MALQQTGDLCMLALHPSGMEDLAKLQSELNEARLDFLHIDLDTAMTLAQIAGSSQPGSDKRARNLANASSCIRRSLGHAKQGADHPRRRPGDPSQIGSSENRACRSGRDYLTAGSVLAVPVGIPN
jgi:hypothetical protein